MNKNGLKLDIPSKEIHLHLPLANHTIDLVCDLLCSLKTDDDGKDAVAVCIDTNHMSDVKKQVVSYLASLKTDNTSRNKLLARLPDVSEDELDSVIAELIGEDCLYQWLQAGKYEVLRIKKQFVERYGGKL